MMNSYLRTGYFGCFKQNLLMPEFTIHMAHLDPANLLPDTCKWACQSMSYEIAAFVNGETETLARSCFCKQYANLTSPVVDIELCRQVPCSGDPSVSCGSRDYVLAYKMNKAYRLTKLNKPGNRTAVIINTFALYGMEFAGQNVTGNFTIQTPYTQVGQETLRFGPTIQSFYDPAVRENI